MRKTRTLLVIICLLLPLMSGAQNAVVTTGGSAENATHRISYSMGQIAVGSNLSATHQLNEGMQQPLVVETVDIAGSTLENALTVYPNPTTMSVTLKRDGDITPAEVRLYTLDGRLLRSERWDEAMLSINLNEYATGVYLLQVNQKTYKITKQ